MKAKKEHSESTNEKKSSEEKRSAIAVRRRKGNLGIVDAVVFEVAPHFNSGNVERVPYTSVPVAITTTTANVVRTENSALSDVTPSSPGSVVSTSKIPVVSTTLSPHDQLAQALNIPVPTKLPRTKRVIILGDAGVGKTCLSFRFCNGRFPGQTEATVGVDFRERSIIMDGELIRVQLWDTAGQERYRQSIVSHYYRNVNAVVFVYDVNDPASFHSLPEWIAECSKHSVTASNDTPHILIGNKCDLKTERRVRTDYAQIFADQNDMALFETSALADSEADHVESIFMTLVHKLQQSKPMHVQSDEERKSKEGRLLLKANEASQLQEDSWCC
uniref:Ras-related protein Rab-33 n=1 Tax=Syphacia muris TaxID=451379 RepID=A0A0N5AHF6_9BILA